MASDECRGEETDAEHRCVTQKGDAEESVACMAAVVSEGW